MHLIPRLGVIRLIGVHELLLVMWSWWWLEELIGLVLRRWWLEMTVRRVEVLVVMVVACYEVRVAHHHVRVEFTWCGRVVECAA